MSSMGPEAFGVATNRTSSGGLILAAYGNPWKNSSGFDAPGPVNGALYGAFAALELLGFGFLHPLQPLLPSSLDLAKLHSAQPFAS